MWLQGVYLCKQMASAASIMIVRNYVLVLLEYHHCCHHRHLPVDQSVILCTKRSTNNSTYSNRQLKLIGYTASFFSTCMLRPMDSLLIILVSTLCSPTGPWTIVFQVFLSFMALSLQCFTPSSRCAKNYWWSGRTYSWYYLDGS